MWKKAVAQPSLPLIGKDNGCDRTRVEKDAGGAR